MNIQDAYEDYYQYIYNYALKLTCHPEDALDLTQETFLKAMKQLGTLENEKALASWLRTICFHEFINRTKKNPNKYMEVPLDIEALESDGHRLVETTPQPEDEIIVEEEIKDLQNGCFLAMVRRLTLHQRTVFSLVDMYGLSINTVADMLGISNGAAKGLLHRARMNLDCFFADHCSIINEKNPCSCKAWLTFSQTRSNLQSSAHKLIHQLDAGEKNNFHNELVRKKLLFLYGNMPEQKPPKEWYQSVLNSLL